MIAIVFRCRTICLIIQVRQAAKPKFASNPPRRNPFARHARKLKNIVKLVRVRVRENLGEVVFVISVRFGCDALNAER